MSQDNQMQAVELKITDNETQHCIVIGKDAHAHNGKYIVVIGDYSEGEGDGATAIGLRTRAIGKGAVAIGDGMEAIGDHVVKIKDGVVFSPEYVENLSKTLIDAFQYSIHQKVSDIIAPFEKLIDACDDLYDLEVNDGDDHINHLRSDELTKIISDARRALDKIKINKIEIIN